MEGFSLMVVLHSEHIRLSMMGVDAGKYNVRNTWLHWLCSSGMLPSALTWSVVSPR
jgi:hypothetical protein